MVLGEALSPRTTMATPTDIQLLLNGSALRPPPGVQSNFVSPKNLKDSLIVAIAVCVSISTLVFWMRMYAKLCIFRKTQLEDYISFLAWLMYVGFCVPCILELQAMGGVHQWNVRLRDLITGLYYVQIGWIMYGIAIALVKLSLLLQYLKIFVPVPNYSLTVLATYVVIWSTSGFYLITTFFVIFACNPREMYWNRLITNGRCFNIPAVNITSAVINCISDFVILLLPQGVIWSLHMPFRTKLGISAIFFTGFLACITSIVRIYYAVRILQTSDTTYNLVLLGLWSHIEITCGIVCGCLPVLPRFFVALQPRVPMFLKSFAQLQNIPQGLRHSRFSGKRGGASSSRGAGEGPYELQREWQSGDGFSLDLTGRKGDSAVTNSTANTKVLSMAPPVGDPTTGLESVESREPNTNRILKTVRIETLRESRDDSILAVAMRPSNPPW